MLIATQVEVAVGATLSLPMTLLVAPDAVVAAELGRCLPTDSLGSFYSFQMSPLQGLHQHRLLQSIEWLL